MYCREAVWRVRQDLGIAGTGREYSEEQTGTDANKQRRGLELRKREKGKEQKAKVAGQTKARHDEAQQDGPDEDVGSRYI